MMMMITKLVVYSVYSVHGWVRDSRARDVELCGGVVRVGPIAVDGFRAPDFGHAKDEGAHARAGAGVARG